MPPYSEDVFVLYYSHSDDDFDDCFYVSYFLIYDVSFYVSSFLIYDVSFYMSYDVSYDVSFYAAFILYKI